MSPRWENNTKLDFIYLVDQFWYNDLSNVVPERGFECEAALTVEEEVFGKTGPIFAKSFVELNRKETRSMKSQAGKIRYTQDLGPWL